MDAATRRTYVRVLHACMPGAGWDADHVRALVEDVKELPGRDSQIRSLVALVYHSPTTELAAIPQATLDEALRLTNSGDATSSAARKQHDRSPFNLSTPLADAVDLLRSPPSVSPQETRHLVEQALLVAVTRGKPGRQVATAVIGAAIARAPANWIGWLLGLRGFLEGTSESSQPNLQSAALTQFQCDHPDWILRPLFGDHPARWVHKDILLRVANAAVSPKRKAEMYLAMAHWLSQRAPGWRVWRHFQSPEGHHVFLGDRDSPPAVVIDESSGDVYTGELPTREKKNVDLSKLRRVQ